MILFINPLIQFLAKSEKQAKIVFWGVELTPTPSENKSLEVMGLYYGRLLGYIKFHIDAAIAEMEQQEQAIAPAIPSESSDTDPQKAAAAEAVSDIFPEEPRLKPATQPENTQQLTTEEIFCELQNESLKKRILACKCRQELEDFKVEIGLEKASEIWESLSILEKNHVKTVGLAQKPTNKAIISVGVLVQYTDKAGKKHNARGIGHYLYGKALKDDERAILIDGEFEPVVAKRTQLKPFKDQKPLDDEGLKLLQSFLAEPQT